LRLFRGHHGGEVLQEINAAFFAFAALALLVMARRTFEAQSGMAARAKPRHVTRFGAAFRALHKPILLRGCAAGFAAGVLCAVEVNCPKVQGWSAPLVREVEFESCKRMRRPLDFLVSERVWKNFYIFCC
jgi:hypothetical protein